MMLDRVGGLAISLQTTLCTFLFVTGPGNPTRNEDEAQRVRVSLARTGVVKQEGVVSNIRDFSQLKKKWYSRLGLENFNRVPSLSVTAAVRVIFTALPVRPGCVTYQQRRKFENLWFTPTALLNYEGVCGLHVLSDTCCRVSTSSIHNTRVQ